MIRRNPTLIRKAAPPYLKTNIETIALGVGRQVLHFFPDRVLLYDAKGGPLILFEDQWSLRWALEKDRGVRGVIAVNFLWKPPGPPKAPKELKFCFIASRDAKEKLASLAEHAEKARKAVAGADYPVVLRIVPGASRSFFHGWENELQKALAWFDGKLDWPKELAAAPGGK